MIDSRKKKKKISREKRLAPPSQYRCQSLVREQGIPPIFRARRARETKHDFHFSATCKCPCTQFSNSFISCFGGDFFLFLSFSRSNQWTSTRDHRIADRRRRRILQGPYFSFFSFLALWDVGKTLPEFVLLLIIEYLWRKRKRDRTIGEDNK